MSRPSELIAVAIRNLVRQVPALGSLKLVIRLELRGRGDVQVYRVRIPGPQISKGEPEDARLELAMARADFNRLAEKGALEDWREAYDAGRIRAGGDQDIQRLLATVIERQQARGRLKKAH